MLVLFLFYFSTLSTKAVKCACIIFHTILFLFLFFFKIVPYSRFQQMTLENTKVYFEMERTPFSTAIMSYLNMWKIPQYFVKKWMHLKKTWKGT